MRRFLLLICALLVWVQPTRAHANPIGSEPAAGASLERAPETIRLWFTEPLEPDFSGIRLLDNSGNAISTPPSAVSAADARQMTLAPGDLPDGLYTVAWRVISAADGYSTQGSFAFAVGAATGLVGLAAAESETIPALGAPVRWLDLLGMALAVGSVGFAVCVACAPAHERRMRRILAVPRDGIARNGDLNCRNYPADRGDYLDKNTSALSDR